MITKYSKPYRFIWKILLFAPFKTWFITLFGLVFEICVILMSILSLVSIPAATSKDKGRSNDGKQVDFD